MLEARSIKTINYRTLNRQTNVSW